MARFIFTRLPETLSASRRILAVNSWTWSVMAETMSSRPPVGIQPDSVSFRAAGRDSLRVQSCRSLAFDVLEHRYLCLTLAFLIYCPTSYIDVNLCRYSIVLPISLMV